jgi:hypothetical protein
LKYNTPNNVKQAEYWCEMVYKDKSPCYVRLKR